MFDHNPDTLLGMTMGERIRHRRKELGLSQPELADKSGCGISKQSIWQWETDTYQPKGRKLVALAKGLETTERWLADGNDGNAPEPAMRSRQIGVAQAAASGNMMTLDELDTRSVAGGIDVVDVESKVAQWSVPQGLVRVATNSLPQSIKILTVVGDSMPDSFRPYDKVMVDTTDCNPQPPGIFVVWEGTGLVVKRVVTLPHSDPPRVRVMSENPAYEAYECALGDAQIRGRVLGKWLWI